MQLAVIGIAIGGGWNGARSFTVNSLSSQPLSTTTSQTAISPEFRTTNLSPTLPASNNFLPVAPSWHVLPMMTLRWCRKFHVARWRDSDAATTGNALAQHNHSRHRSTSNATPPALHAQKLWPVRCASQFDLDLRSIRKSKIPITYFAIATPKIKDGNAFNRQYKLSISRAFGVALPSAKRIVRLPWCEDSTHLFIKRRIALAGFEQKVWHALLPTL